MTDTTILNVETVELDGTQYPVSGYVQYQNLAKFENRIVIGDPSKDDDELASTKIYADFSGGLGILNEKEGADIGRYWFGVGLETSKPSQLALTPKVYSWTGTGLCKPLGVINGKFWMSRFLELWWYNPATNAFVDSTWALPDNPSNKPVIYNSKMYISLGATTGYCVFDGTAAPVNGISPTVNQCVEFCLWDTKLVALQMNSVPGRRLAYFDGTTWTYPAGASLVGTGETGLHVKTFFTRGDDPAIYIITNTSVWGYDPVGQQMIPTTLQLPANSANGQAVTVWRAGENLNVASGMGVYAWSGPGGSIAPIGMDRDEGVPIEYTGKIMDLEPGLNEMYAIVKVPNRAGYLHGLFSYNGIGWRCIHQHTNSSDFQTWSMLSSIGDDLALYWGWGSTFYWMKVPFGYANPRQIVREGILDYETTGYVITSWFDANMQEFDKLLSHFYSRQSAVALDNTSGAARPNIQLQYQLDDETAAWSAVRTSYTPVFQNDLNFTARKIRFKITYNKGTLAAATPATSILDALVLKYIKVPSLYGSWTFTVNLAFEGFWGPPDGTGVDKDAQTIRHELDALLAKGSFITFGHQGNTYRTRISRVSGADSTAMDRRGSRTVTVVEVPFSGNTVQIA